MSKIKTVSKSSASRLPNPVGLIDIGLGSLRLVVYQQLDRVLPTIFNEKAMCALGRGFEVTRQLHPEGIAQALAALERFASIVKGLGVKNCELIAVSVLKEASNIDAFAREIKQRTGFKLRVIDSAEEALYSAQGVLFGIPDASGVIGDLDGGGLELTMIEQGQVQQTASAPLGPMRLMETGGGKIATIERVVNHHLTQTFWLQSAMRKTVYPVGGNWRALAQLYMEETGYPLQVVHNYTVPAKDFAEFLNQVSRNPEKYQSSTAISKSRLEALPYAALVLERLLAFSRPDQVVFSVYGLREGYLYGRLDEEAQKSDPLQLYAAAVSRRPGQAGFAPALVEWTAPWRKSEIPGYQRLRQAICHMSDVSWAEHPEYRARHALNYMLSLPVGTLSHAERAFIALTLYVRYAGLSDLDDAAIASKLMPNAWVEEAHRLGTLLRLAYTMTGGAASLLAESSLKFTDTQLQLKLTQLGGTLLCESVERRLASVAKACHLSPHIVTARA